MQLRLDRGRVRLAAPEEALGVLDVVAHFVRDHVGHGKVALGAHPSELAEKRQVEVDPPVGGAVERAGRRLPIAAPGLGDLVVQHEVRLGVDLAGLAVERAPHVLRLRQDRVDPLGRGVSRLRGLLRRRGRRHAAAAQKRSQVDAEKHPDKEENQPAKADPDPSAASARAAAVDEVSTGAAGLDQHGGVRGRSPGQRLAGSVGSGRAPARGRARPARRRPRRTPRTRSATISTRTAAG